MNNRRHLARGCLNPCCSGNRSRRINKKMKLFKIKKVLILVVVEIGLGAVLLEAFQ